MALILAWIIALVMLCLVSKVLRWGVFQAFVIIYFAAVVTCRSNLNWGQV